jgi:hypothetical protein
MVQRRAFIIKAPGLDLDVIVNTSVFILPLGNNCFKVGATYNWKDKTDLPTEEGKTELIDRIKEIITCDFEIVQHLRVFTVKTEDHWWEPIKIIILYIFEWLRN